MQRKIIYLINPISGTKGKSSLKELIVRETNNRQLPFEILPTAANGNYDFVKQKIETEQVTDVVICGGDGTVNQVVKALAHTNVQFGIIPMGSGNGLALAAGIPKASAKALDIIFTGKAILTDGFMVNEHFACMLCGLGFDAQVAHQFADEPKRGLGTYVSLTTRHFFSAKPYPFRVIANCARSSLSNNRAIRFPAISPRVRLNCATIAGGKLPFFFSGQPICEAISF